MKFISIKEAMKKGSGKVDVRGWVYRERGSNKVKFIVLRDGSDIIQCVFDRKKFENKWDELDKLTIESSIEIGGTIKKDERAPTGYEIKADNYKLIQPAEPFPITKDQSKEFLLENRHLWLRSRKMVAVMKVRDTVMSAFREFYHNKGYYEFSTPVLQPTQSEGGSTLFSVNYYKDKLYLAQTWQLYGEIGILALEKVFNIGPCFRAEKSKTSRHLSEFWMAEMEAAWMKLPEMLKSIEGCIEYIVKQVLKKNMEELKILERDINKLRKIKKPFPRMTYTEALEILKKKDKINFKWGEDLRTIEEDKLSKHFDKPIIITNYPKDVMAFYKPEDPNDKKTVLCVDVIAPEGYGEIVGGSQRDLDVEEMKRKLRKEGEKPEEYNYYFDTRKYGSVPHSGYGLGIERVVSWVCGLDNIKDSISFPRTMSRFKP